MASLIGQMRNVLIAGRVVPGVVVGESIESTVQVASRDPQRAGQMVNIPVVRADIITLRETNPALGEVREYLTITPENLRFTTPRFQAIVGLDATEGGEKLSVKDLIGLTEKSMADFQLARLASRALAAAEPELALDA